MRFGASSTSMRSAIARNDLRRFVVGIRDHDRLAVVAALAQLGHERHLAEQRHLELVGELLAAALAEELVLGAVVAPEPRHVLDHADRPARFTLRAMYAARCATFCAAGCGVVTTMTSARGRNCAIESAMSPVPGGMSTTR